MTQQAAVKALSPQRISLHPHHVVVHMEDVGRKQRWFCCAGFWSRHAVKCTSCPLLYCIRKASYIYHITLPLQVKGAANFH